MANLKIVPGTTKTLFTGTVEINGNIKRINLERGLFVNRAEKFFVYISNTSGDRDPDFPVPVDCPSWDKVFSFLSEIGLKPIPNSNNQGEIIFQAKTDFMGHPAVGVKIYKTANNDYECVLSKQFNPPCAPLYERNSFTESTLEEIFSQIENLKTFFYRLWILKQKQIYGSTPNPDF